MTLYSKVDCPLCSVAKVKLSSVESDYKISYNEEEMEKLNIDSLPVLVLDDGTKLGFKEIVDYVNAKKEKL